jgi:class 3 adenylate cyclase
MALTPCPSCNYPNPRGRTSCFKCNASLSVPAAPTATAETEPSASSPHPTPQTCTPDANAPGSLSPGSAASSTQRAHVLFIDVVGLSLRSMDEQRAIYNELNDVVCRTKEYARSKAGHSVLCRPSGDGMALVFLDHIEAPLRCALELATELQHPGSASVRMGIHSGEIYRVTDINGVEDVTGEGIIVARRVMDCGDAGHILVSSAAAEELEQSAEWREWLHFLGACRVKHGKRVAIWNAYNGEIGNRRMPQNMVQQIAQETLAPSRLSRLLLVRSRPTVVELAVFVAAWVVIMVVIPSLWLRSPAGWPLVLALVLTGALTVYLILSYSRRDRP